MRIDSSIGDITFFSNRFISSQSQVYGNNMIDVGTPNALPATWAFYNGNISDANLGLAGVQDGVIESQDYLDMENAISSILTGYVVQDITGDGISDSADYTIMENNVSSLVFVVRP